MQTFSRVTALIGQDKFQILKGSHVAVFGVGGVGGFCVEALARSGVGEITIVDNDVVAKSNLNRQIISTTSVLGQDKVSVMKDRLLSINPEIKVNCINLFYLPENSDKVDFSNFDYVVDAVDTVSAKLAIIERAKEFSLPVISCMGTGGKLDTTKIKVAKIEKTSGCPLARVMRRELKKRNITGVKVVYSEETCSKFNEPENAQKDGQKRTPPSMIFVPAVAGLTLAKEVVLDLIGE